ncbi:bile acid:sodium symporter [Nitzschia inconspicua]|uniref:Bile acid:sodium symporter n=1 Tax=Nitzschia inconspicua TaxID=303405 RepID=A0A9K3K4Q1_9STRA|nr:bile acid:sodium symporter [Nitzschia inconspicua]KAG7361344.1 bile acid:sodium symporter [Nitzschia inconspicua]
MGNKATEIGAHFLLFLLVFGMSATVDIGHMRKQLRNRTALMIGMCLQFIILPFVGFCIVKILGMNAATGVTLLVVTSSPGGSYSNWWCSLFNAELALSVTMTGISTLLSVVMLPLNLVIYTTGSYSNEVVKALDWSALFVSLVVVIGGIAAGVISSAWYNSTRFNLLANKLGNIAGISLVIFSVVVSSSDSEANLWSQNWKFYVGVAAPALIGVSIATYLATKFALDKPERVAVAVEGCYQNTGIATSVAASMFSGTDLAMAISVPLLYGIFEAAILAVYCMVCWKIGWTKAPANENFCTMIVTSYEVEQARLESPNAIEVVHNNNPKGDGDIEDLVFNQTIEGYQVDEVSLHEKTNASLQTASSTEAMDRTRDMSIDDEDDIKAEAGEFT